MVCLEPNHHLALPTPFSADVSIAAGLMLFARQHPARLRFLSRATRALLYLRCFFSRAAIARHGAVRLNCFLRSTWTVSCLVCFFSVAETVLFVLHWYFAQRCSPR